MAGQIFYEKLKLETLCIKNNVTVMLCLCKQANICMSVLLHVSLRKMTPESGVKFLVFYTFL